MNKEEQIDRLLEGLKEVIRSEESDTVKLARIESTERLWRVGVGLAGLAIIVAGVIFIFAHGPLCTPAWNNGIVTSVCN